MCQEKEASPYKLAVKQFETPFVTLTFQLGRTRRSPVELICKHSAYQQIGDCPYIIDSSAWLDVRRAFLPLSVCIHFATPSESKTLLSRQFATLDGPLGGSAF